MMTQSHGCNLQQLQHSRNKKIKRLVDRSIDSLIDGMIAPLKLRLHGAIQICLLYYYYYYIIDCCCRTMLGRAPVMSTSLTHQHSAAAAIQQQDDLVTAAADLDSYEVLSSHHTHTHGPLSRTTLVSRYQKGKTNLDFTEARDSEYCTLKCSRVKKCAYSIHAAIFSFRNNLTSLQKLRDTEELTQKWSCAVCFLSYTCSVFVLPTRRFFANYNALCRMQEILRCLCNFTVKANSLEIDGKCFFSQNRRLTYGCNRNRN